MIPLCEWSQNAYRQNQLSQPCTPLPVHPIASGQSHALTSPSSPWCSANVQSLVWYSGAICRASPKHTTNEQKRAERRVREEHATLTIHAGYNSFSSRTHNMSYRTYPLIIVQASLPFSTNISPLILPLSLFYTKLLCGHRLYIVLKSSLVSFSVAAKPSRTHTYLESSKTAVIIMARWILRGGSGLAYHYSSTTAWLIGSVTLLTAHTKYASFTHNKRAKLILHVVAPSPRVNT
ncbi:unnamed protein product [Ectocarpus sp. 12 AP-2014]